jgi:hypothetical protein
MPRTKTLFIYNTTKNGQNQKWHIHSEGIVDKEVTVGPKRESFTLNISGDVTIHFGVDSTIYLRTTYDYNTDSWISHTDTPKEIEFSAEQSAITVSSSYAP